MTEASIGRARGGVEAALQASPPTVMTRPGDPAQNVWRLQQTVRYLADYVDYLERRLDALEAGKAQ